MEHTVEYTHLNVTKTETLNDEQYAKYMRYMALPDFQNVEEGEKSFNSLYFTLGHWHSMPIIPFIVPEDVVLHPYTVAANRHRSLITEREAAEYLDYIANSQGLSKERIVAINKTINRNVIKERKLLEMCEREERRMKNPKIKTIYNTKLYDELNKIIDVLEDEDNKPDAEVDLKEYDECFAEMKNTIEKHLGQWETDFPRYKRTRKSIHCYDYGISNSVYLENSFRVMKEVA